MPCHFGKRVSQQFFYEFHTEHWLIMCVNQQRDLHITDFGRTKLLFLLFQSSSGEKPTWNLKYVLQQNSYNWSLKMGNKMSKPWFIFNLFNVQYLSYQIQPWKSFKIKLYFQSYFKRLNLSGSVPYIASSSFQASYIYISFLQNQCTLTEDLPLLQVKWMHLHN